jgi:glucokinase
MAKLKSSASLPKNAVIAVDLGGTKVASALFMGDGRPSGKRSVQLEGRTGAEVGALVTAEVRRLTTAAARRSVTVKGVGICVPGIVSRRTGRVWAPNIARWDDYPLRDEVRQTVGDKTVKIVVENDRAASILGEAWQGAARGCSDAIFLAVGTGIGAGILVNGRVLQGSHGIAGAIGWLALDRPFLTAYESCGCFESHASGDGIAKVAQTLLSECKRYRGPLRSKRDVTAHDVFAAYEAGDEIAKEVVRGAVELWGMASANLISLFNPEKIIFGGGIFGPATRFIDDIAAEARRWAQPIAIQQVTFEASQLAGDAALYGAAYRAFGKTISTTALS